ANVDRSRRGPERRQSFPCKEPRLRTQKSLDEIFSCAAISSRIAPRLQLARQDAPAERRIAERAGNEDLVAGTRRVSSHHATPDLAKQRNRDRQLARARNIAAHDIRGGFARRIAQPGVNSV